MPRCIALLSGGLDSMLAIRMMQEQGIEVEGLNFKTVFTCCQDQAGQAAHELGIKLTVLAQEDDYLDLIREPMFGYGRGANPCIDCRIYMFRKAHAYMQKTGADFIISGEVIGQRPMSQKRRDLDVISHHSDLEDYLLRPLSAKMLPLTKPERDGIVDREKLHGFCGRSRKGLIALAHKLGLKSIPQPSTGCALTEQFFSQKVFDLIHNEPDSGRWEFELLKVGRHYRFDGDTKVIVGRNAEENTQLQYARELPDAAITAWLRPDNFAGPAALVVGSATQAAIDFAAGLILRYAKEFDPANAQVLVTCGDQTTSLRAHPTEESAHAKTLATAQ